jgi:DNA-binding transcriptional LysR family regulator
MPERVIEMSSYHAILGCVVAGMGISLVPRSVLSTFPERRRLSIHALPRGQDRAQTVLIWRKGAGSPKIAALLAILAAAKRARPATPKRRA